MIFRVHTLVRSFTLNGRASKVSLTSPNPEIQCNGVAIPKYSQTQTIATGMVFFFSEQGPECGQGYVMKMARGKKKKKSNHHISHICTSQRLLDLKSEYKGYGGKLLRTALTKIWRNTKDCEYSAKIHPSAFEHSELLLLCWPSHHTSVL